MRAMLPVVLFILLCCGGPQEHVEEPVRSTAELSADIDLGLATVRLQADAFVTEDETSICTSLELHVLAIMEVTVSFTWEIEPSPASWHLCVEAFGTRRCVDG